MFRGRGPAIVARSDHGTTRAGRPGATRLSECAFSSTLASRLNVEEALKRALEENAALKARLAGEPNRARDARIGAEFEDIVGQTPAVLRLLDQICASGDNRLDGAGDG